MARPPAVIVAVPPAVFTATSGFIPLASIATVVWRSGKVVPMAAPAVKFGPPEMATTGATPGPTVALAGAEIANGGGGGGGAGGGVGVLSTKLPPPPPQAANARATEDAAAKRAIRSCLAAVMLSISHLPRFSRRKLRAPGDDRLGCRHDLLVI